jgi:hypothetical protein
MQPLIEPQRQRLQAIRSRPLVGAGWSLLDHRYTSNAER